jgi:hemerythrin
VALLEWSDDYNTGIPAIDRDHKGLFALVNDLYEKVEEGFGTVSVEVSIEALVDYVNIHFAREEGLMKSAGYTDLQPHIATHRKLQREVEAFQILFDKDQENFDMTEFIGFLSRWLKGHILETDMDYVSDLQRHQTETANLSSE